LRLCDLGRELGLLPDRNFRTFETKREAIAAELTRLASTRIGSDSYIQLLRRPEVSWRDLPGEKPDLDQAVIQQVEIAVKYEGYIQRQQDEVERFRRMEEKRIPESFDYDNVISLRKEARQKLSEMRPATVGQASRISGVSPSDISVLLVWLKRESAGNHR